MTSILRSKVPNPGYWNHLGLHDKGLYLLGLRRSCLFILVYCLLDIRNLCLCSPLFALWSGHSFLTSFYLLHCSDLLDVGICLCLDAATWCILLNCSALFVHFKHMSCWVRSTPDKCVPLSRLGKPGNRESKQTYSSRNTWLVWEMRTKVPPKSGGQARLRIYKKFWSMGCLGGSVG